MNADEFLTNHGLTENVFHEINRQLLIDLLNVYGAIKQRETIQECQRMTFKTLDECFHPGTASK